MSLINSGPNLSLPDHVLLHYFHLGLNKEAVPHLDISSGGSFSHKTISEGKPFFRKSLKTPLTLALLMNFLKKKSSQAPTNKRRHMQLNPKFLQILLVIWLPKNLPLREHTTP